MNHEEALARFPELRVAVVGDAMLDLYSIGSARRLCTEAPGPVVDVAARRLLPGGAANTARNVAELGGDARLISVVGDDAEGAALMSLLGSGTVGSGVVRVPDRRTLVKHRIVVDGSVLLRTDEGDTAPPGEGTVRQLEAQLDEAMRQSDAVIVSDYGYGVVTPGTMTHLAELSRAHGTPIHVDSKRLEAFRKVRIATAKPNYAQAIEILRLPAVDPGPSRISQMEREGSRLLRMLDVETAVVTLDKDGALVIGKGAAHHHAYAGPTINASPTGGGDTFIAAFALARAAGLDPPRAADLASAAAAVVVEKNLTGTSTPEEVAGRLIGAKCVPELERMSQLADVQRRQGRRIVLTGGCFDVLHRGHVMSLARAKALGDFLVVAVNGDDSVRRLKGPDRPFNPLEERIGVLSGLSAVDMVVPFDDPVPLRVIETLRPDVYVKGGDYRRRDLPEAALVERLGGRVVILPFVADLSTTTLAERIRAATAPQEPRLRSVP